MTNLDLKTIRSALQEAQTCLAAVMEHTPTLEAISKAATLMASVLQADKHIYSCGNGGSHCDAMHFAEELSGRFRENRRPFAAMAISDPAHITCTGNDFGFDEIFARFISAHSRQGDVLLAISTSGKSKNILKASAAAKARGAHVVALTGKPNSELATLADVEICTPGGTYADRVQELHIKIIHILIELIERRLAPENYR